MSNLAETLTHPRLQALRQEVLEANRALPATGLVTLTWGNVSGHDAESGIVLIKPSGIDYTQLKLEDLIALDLEGNVLSGELRPSSDTPTHLELYRSFPELGGIVHTHSPAATAFAQAGKALPCLGTTHADHFAGTVPLVRILTEQEIEAGYEHHTGVAIAEEIQRQLDQGNTHSPLDIPAILQHHHAPFTWGKSPQAALDNSIALEMCARMALDSYALNPNTPPLPNHLLQKHHQRKHGPDAYYGQK